MASQTSIKKENKALQMPVLLRMARPERDSLWKLLFRRYPDAEWGSFIRLGWRETPGGLVLTVTGIDIPLPGDLNELSEIVEIQSQYTKRMLHMTEEHPFAVGVVHSHPEDYKTYPSSSDYDMEDYYANLLKGYTNARPFVSLIFSKSEFGDNFSGSGRVWWKGQWHEVTQFAIEDQPIIKYNFKQKQRLSKETLERVARLTSIFSVDAAERLAGATVGVVGLSGTGSPIVELLARAGIGKLILIDPDVFSNSNLERLHGSVASDLGSEVDKCLIAIRHVKSINPDCEVIAIKGRLPQAEVLDAIVWADLIFGCTDLHSARVALSDLSLRFCIPIIDMGVVMEGADGLITGQAIQLNRLFPGDACVYCRGMIDSILVRQELMSEEEKVKLKQDAENAKKEGKAPNAYWVDTPQLNTVGYLTTMAGSMATGFGIGYLSGRFEMPNNRLEISLNRRGYSIIEQNVHPKEHCRCPNLRGIADQVPTAVLTSPASHWSTPIFYS